MTQVMIAINGIKILYPIDELNVDSYQVDYTTRSVKEGTTLLEIRRLNRQYKDNEIYVERITHDKDGEFTDNDILYSNDTVLIDNDIIHFGEIIR